MACTRNGPAGQSQVSPDMGWVKARLDCSVDRLWTTLCDRLREDLARWRELSGNKTAVIDLFKSDTNLTISRSIGSESSMRASLQKRTGFLDLRLERVASHSDVEAAKQFHLIPSISQNGECCVTVENEELAIWQVSRLVLEPILF